MLLTFSKVKSIGCGAWIAPLSPSDARRFGQNAPSKGGRSVVGIEAPRFDSEVGMLSVAFDSILILNIGEAEEAVFVDLAPSEKSAQKEAYVYEEAVSPVDEDFLSACHNYLPEDMVKIIKQVLQKVRKYYDDKLIEGEGRKWTTYPRNFMAITIQNRNLQFLVSVKANPSQHSFKKINLKRSRSPYCEFYLNSPSQIQEAIQAILASAEY